MNSVRPNNAALVTFLFIVAIAISALYDLQPPSPLPASAPDTLFSADRAVGYIKEIAREPHPLGSAANTTVRDYIVRQLKGIGIEPNLDTTVVTGSYSGIHYAARVVNIIARIPGADNTKAVLLMAHYDSVPTGPGASDDASGVATLLETLRALKASRPLKNDIVAVFTDGEENGMMGGQALADSNKLIHGIGVALNFEARGTSGPSIMFETSPDSSSGNGNGWLIRQLAASGADPVATSISEEAYKHLPNNTDFTWLKAKGVAGLNFAFIGDCEHYHSEMDNYSNVHESSIQHDGSYALSLAREFGNEQLPGPKYVNYTYFNFFWPTFVAYPSTLKSAITLLAVILFLLTAYVGRAKKVIKLPKAILSVLLSLIPPGLLGVGSYFLWKALQETYPEAEHFYFGAFYNDGLFLIAIIFAAVALTTAYFVYLRKYFRSSEMAMGALFWWLAATVAATNYAPQGAYLFQWPLIFSLLALLLFFVGPKSDFRSPLIMLALLICTIPGTYLTTSTSYLLYLTGVLPGMAAGIVVLVILTIETLLPQVAIVTAPNKWILPVAAIAIAVIFAGVALLTHRLDAEHPKADSMDYALDTNDSTAYWISFDNSPDEWTSQFMRNRLSIDSMPDFFPDWWRRPAMAGKAKPVNIKPASITMTADSTFRGAQFMQLLLKPAPGTRNVTLTAEEGAQILSSTVDGQVVSDSSAIFPSGKRKRWILHYYGVPDSGSTISFVIPVGQRLQLTAVEVVSGLPEVGSLPSYPRPASIMRQPFVTTDASLIFKSYTF